MAAEAAKFGMSFNWDTLSVSEGVTVVLGLMFIILFFISLFAILQQSCSGE